MTENYKFKANINELLNIVINNIYSNKDIFLRELISNASDAINKLKIYNNDNFFIKIIPDIINKKIRIYDNGIGMNKEDIINYIGTIAQSDTKEFAKKINNNNLIGFFGVGFYSSFLVSKKVYIITKKDNYKYYKWESESNDDYTINELESYDDDIIKLDRGTIIECYLKDDCLDYLNDNKIKEIVIKHSQFITYSIYLYSNNIEDPYICLNKYKSIWNCSQSSLLKEDCLDFYKYFYYNLNEKDYKPPLDYKLLYGEGKINYKGIIYLPYENIVDMFDKNKQNNIKLYVKNILITENSKEICPEWLSFLVGIVDIDSIPLNVSRETLQQNDNIILLRKIFIKKSIEFLNDIKIKDFTLYADLFNKYGKFIKLGARNEDNDDNKNKIKDLLIYKSLQTDNKFITLKEYIDTLKKEQKTIYYIINENYESIKKSPYLEKFINKNYNVLFMTEPSDEYLMETFTTYNDYNFVCIGKGVIYLNDTEDEIKEYEKKELEYKKLCDFIKKFYGDLLLTVKISLYLKDTPCIIYSAEYGVSANMEKILKAQTLLTQTKNMKNLMYYKNMELNPYHPIVIKLKKLYDSKNNSKDLKDLNNSNLEDNIIIDNNYDDCIDMLNMLYTTSLLHSGYNIQCNTKYIKNIYKLLEYDFDNNLLD